jgi:NAD(P)H-hydrate epimerase
MTGMAALRAGAGLVTVASDASTLPAVAAYAPELMTEPLDDHGFSALVRGKRALALGPGFGVSSSKRAFLERTIAEHNVPTVIDADGLNNLGKRRDSAEVEPDSYAAPRRDGTAHGAFAFAR